MKKEITGIVDNLNNERLATFEKEFNLSEKNKEVAELCDCGKIVVTGGMKFLKEEDVKEFIKLLKEKDLYRSLVKEYTKIQLFSLGTANLIDLIEDYFNNKIDKLAGEKLI